MGGERIALSGVETERCNLYFTSMFRPAGQLSLMQASGLWYCIGQVWNPLQHLEGRVDDAPPMCDSRNASQRRFSKSLRPSRSASGS
jgi:hypothetical protein